MQTKAQILEVSLHTFILNLNINYLSVKRQLKSSLTFTRSVHSWMLWHFDAPTPKRAACQAVDMRCACLPAMTRACTLFYTLAEFLIVFFFFNFLLLLFCGEASSIFFTINLLWRSLFCFSHVSDFSQFLCKCSYLWHAKVLTFRSLYYW